MTERLTDNLVRKALPPARGQTYTLRVGAFFDLKDGFILRVANHYNVADWLAQVR